MKGKTIFGLLCIVIPAIIMTVYFFYLPSKKDKQQTKDNFILEMGKYEKIDEIIVIYNWDKVVTINNKEIIKEICKSATTLNYETHVFQGGYLDKYLIKVKSGNKYYNFRFDKNIQYEDKCKKQLSDDGQNFYGENIQNDCGQLSLLKNSDYEEIEMSSGSNDFVAYYRNLTLIPVIIKYVDPLINNK